MTSTRATLKTRKPIDALRAADLEAFPVWEFAADEEDIEGQDETWVRPVDSKTVPKGAWSLSVAARFKTASEKIIPGFVTVSTADGVELGPCVLLHQRKYVFVDARTAASRARVARALGLSVAQTFPLTFELRVLIGKEKTLRAGTVV